MKDEGEKDRFGGGPDDQHDVENGFELMGK